ncbi:Arrestin domain-containing protein 3 TBP-2-like inducible membrane protein [Collichthys lucidus]|uniref:Arrestin domain-containing protein 3 TBP-2-like inducible membrane protein n=1 Tax=Collichthys lucidus TaxID=240159 RepID=A0A4U5UUJ5_COLLU|nr:Arrestin domain-containing protein 3 TBP-2-like inducible membrane protein [Collichthys lucidus]
MNVGDLPPSFSGKHGKIEYTLEANLSRAMKKDKRATASLTLVHNVDPRSDPVLMTPQCKASVKKMLFTSGTVSMDVYTERTAFYQGECIKVVAAIQNKSTRDVRPKYRFYLKQSFFVKGKKKVSTQEIQREVGDAIPPSTSPTVTRILTIPPDMNASILNCAIIKVEYKVVVYLDIKYALDPEIKFPIVILPALKEEEQQHQPAYPVYGSGTSANSYVAGRTSFLQNSYAAGRTNFLQNSTASGPSAPPPSYGKYGLYPSTNFRGKY